MDKPLSRFGRSPAATDSSDPGPHSARAEESITRSQVERSYRRYAPVHDLLFGARLSPGRGAMTRLVSRLAPQHVLEVGLGTGLTLPQCPAAARIAGVDVSRDKPATAQRRVQQKKAPGISSCARWT